MKEAPVLRLDAHYSLQKLRAIEGKCKTLIYMNAAADVCIIIPRSHH